MMKILLLLLPAFVYLKTLPPSILWVDSGTMVAAAYSLGIPNPPGFPTYIMASHLFTLLPFGTVLFRMQLFTVVFAVLTILLLYRIILLVLQLLNLSVQTFKARLSATFGSIALAFSYEFWSQAHNTDAFMFTDFLLVLILYLILKIQLNRTNKQKVFYGFLLVAVIFGLAAGANPTISLFVPSTLFALFLNRKFLTVKGLAVQFALFALLAVAVYSYLPLRAGQYPPVNWNNPQTLTALLRHISGSGLNVYAPGSDIVNGFTGSPLIFLQSLTYFVWFGIIEFTPLLLPFLFVGLAVIWQRGKQLLILLLLPVLVDMTYTSLYFSGNQESWFILSFIFFAIFIGVGFYSVVIRIKQSKLIIPLALMAFLPLLWWWHILDRSKFNVINDYAAHLYLPLRKNALLIGYGDIFGSLSYYMRVADGRRSDVTPIVINQFYFSNWMRDNLKQSGGVVISRQFEDLSADQDGAKYNLAMNQFFADNIEKYPIYVLPFIIESSIYPNDPRGKLVLDGRFDFVPYGLTLQVVKKAEKKPMPYFDLLDFKFNTPNFPDQTPLFLEKSYSRNQADVMYLYTRAHVAAGDWWMFDEDNPGNAFFWYKKARNFQEINPELYSRFGYYYLKNSDFEAARQYLEKATGINPYLPNYHYLLSNAYLGLGKIPEARAEAQIVESLDPGGEMSRDLQKQISKAFTGQQ